MGKNLQTWALVFKTLILFSNQKWKEKVKPTRGVGNSVQLRTGGDKDLPQGTVWVGQRLMSWMALCPHLRSAPSVQPPHHGVWGSVAFMLGICQGGPARLSHFCSDCEPPLGYLPCCAQGLCVTCCLIKTGLLLGGREGVCAGQAEIMHVSLVKVTGWGGAWPLVTAEPCKVFCAWLLSGTAGPVRPDH